MVKLHPLTPKKINFSTFHLVLKNNPILNRKSPISVDNFYPFTFIFRMFSPKNAYITTPLVISSQNLIIFIGLF